MLIAKKLAAGLEDQLEKHQSSKSHADAAERGFKEAQQQLQLLQQSHQDLSDRFQESSARCSQLQVQLSALLKLPLMQFGSGLQLPLRLRSLLLLLMRRSRLRMGCVLR